MSKTNGQLLYEKTHPKHIKVVRWERRKFATADDILLMDNPVAPTPWEWLTEASKASWEMVAVGHDMFSKEEI